MIDWLLVARSNNYGLTQDAAILAAAIEAAGKDCAFAERRSRGFVERLFGRRRAKRILHVERAFPAWFSASDENWLIPNQERFPRRHVRYLRHIDRVLAKTRHAEEIFAELGVAVDYLGFTSPDRLDRSVKKDWRRFLHLAGASTLKGTEDVLALWQRHPEWPELVLVQKAENAPKEVPANVTLHSGFMSDEELQRLQNACGVHLCPSRSEGWGHHIVEALSVGALVIATDAPPMNEHVDAGCGLPVAVATSQPRHLGTNFHVDPAALEAAIETAIAMPEAAKEQLGASARARFEEIDHGFRRRAVAIFAASKL